jgi:hypothetical protein
MHTIQSIKSYEDQMVSLSLVNLFYSPRVVWRELKTKKPIGAVVQRSMVTYDT